MKLIRMSVFLALGAAIVFAACGGNDDDKSAATSGSAALTATFDLSTAHPSLPLTVKVPAGATAKAISPGAEVKAGTDFQLEITTFKGDVPATKKEIQARRANVLKRFLVDNSSGIVYETAVDGKSEFHTYVAVAIGTGYSCEDIKGTVYTEAQAKTMYEACKSIAAK